MKRTGINKQENSTGGDGLEKITGTVERIVFTTPDTGYTVARIRVADSGGECTVVGKVPSLQVGEDGEFYGKWVTNKKFGKQFQVEKYHDLRPSTTAGIEKYLGSGMVKGIGPELARRLVKRFGADTLNVIDSKPELLSEVNGIGATRIKMILSAWDSQKKIRDIMVFLQGHGIGPGRAVKIYKQYGDDAIETVKKNPYKLAEDIRGIGFLLADDIARKVGFSEDSPYRAEAAVLHSLREASEEGHCYLPLDELKKRCTEKLGIPESVFSASLETLTNDCRLTQNDNFFYLTYFFRCEEQIAKYLDDIKNSPAGTIGLDPQQSLDLILEDPAFEPSPGQKQALLTSFREKISIITGGPGVGKTTILKALVDVLHKAGRSVALCAPTGRAAKRMTESIGHEAKTIHRLLEFKPGNNSFLYNREKKLRYDWIIVDEMSMVDTPLFLHLLAAIDPASNLTMVGDVDQLPSVGAGQILKDLIDSKTLPTTFLREVHRQKADSLIIKNAHKINNGYMPDTVAPAEFGDKLRDYYFVECDTPEKTREILLKMVTGRIPAKFRLDPVDDIQVLTPMIKGDLGVDSLNRELQTVLNPGKPGLCGFHQGDKVMQMRNNYDKEVFNGDIGRVHSVNMKDQLLQVSYDGKIVEYDNTELDEIKTAYACTVHKSQGSEFPAVVMPLYTGHFILLERNLLYTAVTRAKKLVVLVDTKKALAIAVKSCRAGQRFTGLKEKLVNAVKRH